MPAPTINITSGKHILQMCYSDMKYEHFKLCYLFQGHRKSVSNRTDKMTSDFSNNVGGISQWALQNKTACQAVMHASFYLESNTHSGYKPVMAKSSS